MKHNDKQLQLIIINYLTEQIKELKEDMMSGAVASVPMPFAAGSQMQPKRKKKRSRAYLMALGVQAIAP